jgi:UrcA family protein
MRRILTLAIAASLIPASAGAATEKVTEVVSFDDLDLLDPQGVHTLEERIAIAVINVCGAPEERSIWAARAVEDCRSAAAEDAKAQLEARLATLAPVSVAAAD